MGLFDKLFGKPEEPVHYNALLNPWYFKENEPHLVRNGQPLIWTKEKTGLAVLNGTVPLGMLKMYAYVQPNMTGDRFLTWYRYALIDIATPTITLFLYNTKDLREITQFENATRKFSWDKTAHINFNCEPEAEITIRLEPDSECQRVIFPDAFHEFEEIIMVIDIPDPDKMDKVQWSMTVIIILKPREGLVFVYPQDWFNKNDKIDFGYEWITMAGRDPKTGFIKGTGIKLDDFTLNETNREILRY